MQRLVKSFTEIFSSCWRNKDLIWALSTREVLGRYRGSTFGLFWSFLHPLLTLSVYTFVFGFIFKSRWAGTETSISQFALILFSGLIVFNFFAECLTRSCGLITANVNYVKKVVFPLEVFAYVTLITAFFHALMCLIVWFVFYTVFFGLPPLTALLLPIILIPFVFFVLGCVWFFSALSVYIQDVSQIVGLVTTMLMFMTPLFYPIKSIPVQFRNFVLFNPLSITIEQVRDVIMWGKVPDWSIFFYGLFFAIVIAWLGFVSFKKMRVGFADVL